jgi:hypothetical protein
MHLCLKCAAKVQPIVDYCKKNTITNGSVLYGTINFFPNGKGFYQKICFHKACGHSQAKKTLLGAWMEKTILILF